MTVKSVNISIVLQIKGMMAVELSSINVLSIVVDSMDSIVEVSMDGNSTVVDSIKSIVDVSVEIEMDESIVEVSDNDVLSIVDDSVKIVIVESMVDAGSIVVDSMNSIVEVSWDVDSIIVESI